jgi:triosephosphate isomerase
VHQAVVFAVPFPYLIMAKSEVAEERGYHIAAQNCYHESAGAFTGEVSVDMLKSIGIKYCVIGHSERRMYFNESNEQLASKVTLLLAQQMIPIFCCGEPLSVRESGQENDFVATQIQASLFHLKPEEMEGFIIAYEPIWAIGTGRTASTEQAQAMHAHLRDVIAAKYGAAIADSVSILYGGSVKGSNAKELFTQPDVDGGLVGGASLNAEEFVQIIRALP